MSDYYMSDYYKACLEYIRDRGCEYVTQGEPKCDPAGMSSRHLCRSCKAGLMIEEAPPPLPAEPGDFLKPDPEPYVMAILPRYIRTANDIYNYRQIILGANPDLIIVEDAEVVVKVPRIAFTPALNPRLHAALVEKIRKDNGWR